MKKNVFLTLLAAVLCSGCSNEFNNIYKSTDIAYKYECAKEYFAKGKFNQSATLLQDVVTSQKGRSAAQESLYMLALAEYNNRDYEAASQTFKKYFSSYPKGDYAEQAAFYIGQNFFKTFTYYFGLLLVYYTAFTEHCCVCYTSCYILFIHSAVE